jgi:hypothetical protein
MKKDFMVGLLALVAQLSGIVSVLAIAGVFYGAPDAFKILLVSGTIFLVTFIIVTKIKDAWTWLIVWSLPWPF